MSAAFLWLKIAPFFVCGEEGEGYVMTDLQFLHGFFDHIFLSAIFPAARSNRTVRLEFVNFGGSVVE